DTKTQRHQERPHQRIFTCGLSWCLCVLVSWCFVATRHDVSYAIPAWGHHPDPAVPAPDGELQGRGTGSHGCGSTWKTCRASSRPARRQQPEASPLRDISLSTFPTPPALPACL